MDSFSCNMCSSIFSSSRSLRRHFNSNHSDLKMYMCDQCNRLFNRSDHLKRHYQTHLKVDKANFCGVNGCKKSFIDLEKLNNHRELHRKKLEEGYSVPKETVNGTVWFTCPMEGCSKKYSSYVGMNRHINFHNDPERIKQLRKNVKIYTCEQCSKTFTKKIRLKDHLEGHTQSDTKTDNEQLEIKVVDGKRVFVCPYEECRRIYSKKSNVTMHVVRYHTKEVYFKCDDCGFQFKWRRSLNNHKCKSKI